VTLAVVIRAGAGASNSGSRRTVPVNHSAGPALDGCVPFRLISISVPPGAGGAWGGYLGAAADRE
jgi:hypothetical protein